MKGVGVVGRSASCAVVFFALVVLVLGAGSTRAEAATINFTVVNDRGIPQPYVYIGQTESSQNWTKTDASGRAELGNLNSGDQIDARGLEKVATVPTPVPSSMTITVQDIQLPAPETTLTSKTSCLLGLTNRYRDENGLQILYDSTTLNQVADGYAHYVSGYLNQNPDYEVTPKVHDLYFTPEIRLANSGFPAVELWGAMDFGTISPAEALDDWNNSPPHHLAIVNPESNAVGIGYADSVWEIDIVPFTDIGNAYAGMTSDTGDVSECGKDASKRRTKLKFTFVHIRGHRVQVGLRLSREATKQGRVSLLAQRSGHHRKLTLDSQLIAKAKLGSGRWCLQAKFLPKPDSNLKAALALRYVLIGKQHSQGRSGN